MKILFHLFHTDRNDDFCQQASFHGACCVLEHIENDSDIGNSLLSQYLNFPDTSDHLVLTVIHPGDLIDPLVRYVLALKAVPMLCSADPIRLKECIEKLDLGSSVYLFRSSLPESAQYIGAFENEFGNICRLCLENEHELYRLGQIERIALINQLMKDPLTDIEEKIRLVRQVAAEIVESDDDEPRDHVLKLFVSVDEYLEASIAHDRSHPPCSWAAKVAAFNHRVLSRPDVFLGSTNQQDVQVWKDEIAVLRGLVDSAWPFSIKNFSKCILGECVEIDESWKCKTLTDVYEILIELEESLNSPDLIESEFENIVRIGGGELRNRLQDIVTSWYTIE